MIKLSHLPYTLIALMALGCAQEGVPDTTDPATSGAQPALERAPEAKPRAKRGDKGRYGKRGFHGRRGGPARMLLGTALRTLDLTEDQKTKLEALKPARGDKSTKREQMRAFHDTLVEQIKAGSIDKAKLEPHLATLETVATEKQAAQAKLLNDLHAALTPEQRTALVAEVKKRHEARAAKWAGKQKRGPHMKHGRMAKRHMQRMTRELELTDEQQQKVEALREKSKRTFPTAEEIDKWRTEGKQRMDALLAAFEKDGFDATTLDLGKPFKKSPRDMATRRVDHLSELLPILTAEQRTKLAERVAKGPERFMRGGKGGKRGMRGKGMMGPPPEDLEGMQPSLDDPTSLPEDSYAPEL